MPALADVCVVHWEGDGAPRLAGVRVDGPDGPALEARIRARDAEPPARATRRRALIEDCPAAWRCSPASAAVSAAVVPLRRERPRHRAAHARVAPRPSAASRRQDLRFLQVLAGRLAVALDNVGLVAAERQVEALVSGMEDAVTVRDPDGRILIANPAAVELAGAASLEELRAMPLEAMLERFAIYDADGRPLGADDVSWVRALEGRRAAAPRARAPGRHAHRAPALALVQGVGRARQPRPDHDGGERHRGRDGGQARRARPAAARRGGAAAQRDDGPRRRRSRRSPS